MSTLVLAALAAAPLAQSQVFVVDSSGAGDFTNLPLALDAAADGDTLLVRSLISGFVIIDGKGVNVVVDEGFDVTVGGISVANLTADQQVVVRGFTADGGLGTSFDPGPSVSITDCAGGVYIESVTALATTIVSPFFENVARGVEVENASRVAFVDCTMTGGVSVLEGQPGGPGLTIDGSDVAIYGGSVTGGKGYTHPPLAFDQLPGGPGGDALRSSNSTLSVDGVILSGGAGGDGANAGIFSDGCSAGGAGGTALAADATTLRIRDAVLQGGSGGPGGVPAFGLPACTDGLAGLSQDLVGGSQTVLSGESRQLTVSPNPVREGQTATVAFEGQSGDLVLYLLSPEGIGTFLPTLGGNLVTGNPLFSLAPGVVPANGTLVLSVPIASFASGVEVVGLFEQWLAISTAGEFVLSAPKHVVHLDAGI